MPKFKNSNATFWVIFKQCVTGKTIGAKSAMQSHKREKDCHKKKVHLSLHNLLQIFMWKCPLASFQDHWEKWQFLSDFLLVWLMSAYWHEVAVAEAAAV